MSAQRNKLWYWLNDKDGKVAELDIELDCLDIEIAGLRRIQYEETKAKLERLGLDTTNYRPSPLPLRGEQRCINHFIDGDDIEALVIAASERPLDRAYREHINARDNLQLQPGDKVIHGDGRPIRRTFTPPKITIR